MGLDIFLYDGESHQEIKSELYPDHLCNKAYLRSSYNGAGFNSFIQELTGIGLYEIFEPGGEYEIPLSPEKIETAKQTTTKLIEKIKAMPKERIVAVETISANLFADKPKIDSEQAIKIYLDEIDRNTGSRDYSNINGLFCFDGFEIVAAVPGVDVFGNSGVHLVYRKDVEWYMQMAEIILEFLDHAKTLENPILHWSS